MAFPKKENREIILKIVSELLRQGTGALISVIVLVGGGYIVSRIASRHLDQIDRFERAWEEGQQQQAEYHSIMMDSFKKGSEATEKLVVHAEKLVEEHKEQTVEMRRIADKMSH